MIFSRSLEIGFRIRILGPSSSGDISLVCVGKLESNTTTDKTSEPPANVWHSGLGWCGFLCFMDFDLRFVLTLELKH